MKTSSSNIDREELKKFEAMAAHWWDEEGELRTLHWMNPVRANHIDRLSPVAGCRVLDVGCGGGLLSEALAQRGAEVTGIDMGDNAIAVARQHSEQSRLSIDYRQIEAAALAEELPAHFDLVCCLEVLEHVPEPAELVRQCASLAKPGASLYFSTINRSPVSWFGAILGAEYILGLLPKGTHDYRKLIKPEELDSWLRAANAQTRNLDGIHFNPLTKEISIGRWVGINYILRAVKT